MKNRTMTRKMALLAGLLMGGTFMNCTGTTETNCSTEGARASDPLICPAASPMVIEATPLNMMGTYALNVFNESTRATLEISDVTIGPGEGGNPHPELFSNVQVSNRSVAAGESTIIQYNWAVTALTTEDRTALMTIRSNAKNFPDMKIIILLLSRAGNVRDGGVGDAGNMTSSSRASSSVGTSSSRAPSSSAVASSAGQSSSAVGSSSAVQSSSAAATSAVQSSSAAATSTVQSSSAPASSAGQSSSAAASSSDPGSSSAAAGSSSGGGASS